MPTRPKSSPTPSRFAEKMAKIKTLGLRRSRASLRRSRASLLQNNNSNESSSLKTSSSSSVPEESSASYPSTQSSSSLNVLGRLSFERPRMPRSSPELIAPSHPSSFASPGPPTRSSSVPLSPFAPRLLSVQENQWVHQSILLVLGQVGLTDRPCDGMVTVHHHLEGYPPTQWPVNCGYFKALVHLDPGPNRLRFDFTGTKIPCTSSTMLVNFLPLTSSPPLYMAIVLAKDSPGNYECQNEGKQKEGNDLHIAKRKLRMAVHLAQAFTGEQMYRGRLGRRCFRLEEEWAEDSLSNKDDGAMRNVGKVHVIQTEKTVAEIQQLEATQDGDAIFEIASEAVDRYFRQSANPKRHVAVLMFDSRGDLRIRGLVNRSAMSDGVGVYGSRSLYTFPSYLEEVVTAFTDCTRIGSSSTGISELADSGSFWEAATSAMGNMMEAFISPQPPTELREFGNMNRTFTTKEPYSFKTKSAGLRLCLPQEECSWPRVDCLRLRHHPCFRLPTDPVTAATPDNPQIYAVENGVFACANSGIFLVEIYTNDVRRAHMEFITKIEREVLLLETELRGRLPQDCRSKSMKLKIYSAGQGQTIVEDFSAAKGSKVRLPNGYGIAFKSSSLGLSETSGSKSQEVFLHTLTPGRMLTSIRVFHSSALDGLEFMYEDSSSQLFGHRGNKKDGVITEVSDFSLDTRKGESLLGFCVRSESYVDGIEILTNLGRRSPLFGNPHGGTSRTLIPPRGRSIAGVSGSYAEFVDGFSILYK